MIAPQFVHNATNAFTLWADNVLLKEGYAYTNVTGSLINYPDNRLPPSYSGWGSPHKEWVTNSAVTGAIIPSGFYVDGTFTSRSSSLSLDFENGRVITSGISSSSAITGSYSVKDFNIYNTNQDEESLILEVCQNQSQPYNTVGTNISTPYLQPYAQKVPAIFINTQTQDSDRIAFGGMFSSNIGFNMVVFADNPYQLDGVLGLFSDTGDRVFKELPLEAAPLTQWGDIKGGYYNHCDTVIASGTNNFFIDEVKTSKVTDSLRRGLKTELYIGFVNFKVSQFRGVRPPS